MRNNNSIPLLHRIVPVWLKGTWGTVGILTGFYLIPYLAWFYFHWGGEANAQLISDLASLPLDLLAVLVAGRVVIQQQLDPRLRRAWLLLGLGLSSWLIADIFWLYLGNFLEVPPFPSIADVFYLAFYPLILWGLVSLPGAPLNRRERWEFLLNLFIVMIAGTMFIWYFVVQPTATANQGDLLTQVVAASYPIGDLVLLGGIIAILFRRPNHDIRAAMLLFMIGMAVFVIADLAFGYTNLVGNFAVGGWIDTGWVIAHAFFIWSALRQLYLSSASVTEAKRSNFLDRFTTGLPFIAVGLGYGLTIYASLIDLYGTDTIWLFIGAVTLTLLVIVRQVVTPSFTKLSLRVKLVLAFLAVTILSVGAVAFITNREVSKKLTEQVGTDLKIAANTQAQRIDAVLNKQLELLQSFALSKIVQDEVEAVDKTYNGDPAAIQTQLEKLDQQWRAADAAGTDADPLVQARLNNVVATELLEFRDTFPEHAEVFVTDKYGAIVAATNRTSDYYQADEGWWQAAYNNGQGALYIDQPEFDESTQILALKVAVPLFGHGTREVIGVLRSTYDIGEIVEILKEFGSRGGADLLVAGGLILREESDIIPLDEAALRTLREQVSANYTEFFYDDAYSLVSQAPIVSTDPEEAAAIDPLGWVLILDEDPAQVLAPVNAVTQKILFTGLGALLLASVVAVLAAQPLVKPIVRLTEVAQQIAGGDLSAQAQVESADEIGILATTFNTMTDRLRQTLQGLEDRRQRLEIVDTLSERLSAILKLEELLPEIVNQVQAQLSYYHVHIYLIDDQRERLVVAAGTGVAGAEMKAKGHSIALKAQTSLVARAARTGEIVKVDNVREAPDWLPNPLLPNTYSEMAVPINLAGQVVGVLDVQENKIAGFDESDVNLLRTLANHVAIAIRNAGQFAEVEAALAEAREAQQRYINQAWDKNRVTLKNVGRVYYRSGISTPLAESLIAMARQQGVTQSKPTIVTLKNDKQDGNGLEESQALVAPISWRNVVIGNLQLHDESAREWSEAELALINAVVDQVAQAAENLRLVSETQERASREQFINQVSEKLRRAADMETLLQTGVTELARILGPARTFAHLNMNVGQPPQKENGVKDTAEFPVSSMTIE